VSCPDYDLCAACFNEKALLHGGSGSFHDFEVIILPESSTPWTASCKGKGEGKCKGKGKGKGIWKGCNDIPSTNTSQDGSASHQEIPFGNLLRAGMHMLKGFGKGGLGGHGTCGQHSDSYHGFKLKMLKCGLTQLCKNELLDANCFSALFVSLLPKLMAFIAEHPEKINRKLDKMLVDMPSLLQDLHVLAACTQGLEQCEQLITSWQDHQVVASEALLQFLPALMALPFDAQLNFAQELYARQEQALKSKFRDIFKHRPWIPRLPLVHEGITCDGCDASPIHGLRFKCVSCPDYDLCATCFNKQAFLQVGDCGAHDFEGIIFPECVAPWAAVRKGKGKGDFKGKGKGEFKGKGKGEFKGKGKDLWKGCD